MTRAEQKAVEYQIKTHGPSVIGGASLLSEEAYLRFNMNLGFKDGYEQAEKDTKAELLEWAKEKRAALLNCDATEERKVAALSVCDAFIEKIKSL